MYERKITAFLKEWKEKTKYALLLKGARQVGKSTSIREFGKKNFAHFYEVDLSKDTEALRLLLSCSGTKDFVDRLKLIFRVDELTPEDGVFLDEIQVLYHAREERAVRDPDFLLRTVDPLTLSKGIAEQEGFRLIFSGSLLGIGLFNVTLNPTGYLLEKTMYPMDFEEFLWADSIPKSTIEKARTCLAARSKVPEEEDEKLREEWRKYVVVGGMPEAVRAYLENGESFPLLSLAHQSILSWYRRDILQYAPLESRLVISDTFERIPSEISSRNKKFVKSHLDVPNAKNLDMEDKFLWLEQAGIAIPVFNVSNPVSPLEISRDHKVMKLFSNDCGLLVNQLFRSSPTSRLLLEPDDFDFGSIYENAVAQELVCHGFHPYYWSDKKSGEVDFLVEKDQIVLPVEVKSGKTNKFGLYEHAALDNLLASHREIAESRVYGNINLFPETDRILCLPIYMIDFLRHDDELR